MWRYYWIIRLANRLDKEDEADKSRLLLRLCARVRANKIDFFIHFYFLFFSRNAFPFRRRRRRRIASSSEANAVPDTYLIARVVFCAVLPMESRCRHQINALPLA